METTSNHRDTPLNTGLINVRMCIDEIVTFNDKLRFYNNGLLSIPEHSLVKGNPYNEIRYRRIVAMMKAFGIYDNSEYPVSSFLQGLFIDENAVVSESMITDFHKHMQQSGCTASDIIVSKIGAHRLPTQREMFCMLTDYRCAVCTLNKLLHKYFKHSRLSTFAEKLHRKYIDPIITCIDNMITFFISNNKQEFPIQQLIDEYGYPAISDTELSQLSIEK